jgi:hypothetical protein
MGDVGRTLRLQFHINISLASSDPGEIPDDSSQSITSWEHFLPMTFQGMLMVDRIGEGVHLM